MRDAKQVGNMQLETCCGRQTLRTLLDVEGTVRDRAERHSLNCAYFLSSKTSKISRKSLKTSSCRYQMDTDLAFTSMQCMLPNLARILVQKKPSLRRAHIQRLNTGVAWLNGQWHVTLSLPSHPPSDGGHHNKANI